MNKQRRAQLLEITEQLQDTMDRLSVIREDEQEAFDNLPDNLQCSSCGDAMQGAIDSIEGWECLLYEIQTMIEAFLED